MFSVSSFNGFFFFLALGASAGARSVQPRGGQSLVGVGGGWKGEKGGSGSGFGELSIREATLVFLARRGCNHSCVL